MNCYDELKKSYKAKGDFTALIAGNTEVKLSELLARISGLSSYLSRNFGADNRCISVLMPDSIYSVIVFYALCKSGFDINLIHISEKPDTILSYMDETGSGILIVDGFFSYDAGLFTASGKTVLNIEHLPYEKVITDEKIIHEDSRIFLHGGGTTGENKTSALSQSCFCSLTKNLEFLSSDLSYGEGFSLMVLPMSHSFGLAVSVHTALIFGQGLIPVFPFSAETAVDVMKNHPVSFLVGVPELFRKLTECSGFRGDFLRNIRLAFCGGDFVPSSLIYKFDSLIKSQGGKARLLTGYGLTECASVCCVNSYSSDKAGSCGKPIENTEIRIIDKEIAVSSSCVMSGYLGTENQPFIFDENGKKWLLTGDSGYIDDEGYLFVTGRKKRIFVLSGYNIYPSLLENKTKEVPGVTDCCAGLYNNNGRNSIILFVSTADNKNNAEIKNKITEKIKNELNSFYFPSEIRFIESLPKTSLGKIDYKKIRLLIGENL